MIASLKQTSVAYYDLTDLGSGSDPMAVYNTFRLNKSDSNGIVVFSKITVAEILGSEQTVTFDSYVGQSSNIYL